MNATFPPSFRNPPLSRALAAAVGAVVEVLAGRTPETTLAALPIELRPAARDLAMTALRDYGRGDFFLARLLERPLKDKAARSLLLVALARLERRPEEAHTLVDQAVEAADKPFKKLTNAILRHFQRRRAELIAAADADEVASFRHPRWWLALLAEAYPECWREIAASGNGHPPMTLRLNARCRITSAEFLAQLAKAGGAGQTLDETAILLEAPLPVERLPGFQAGCVSVQDWGAQQAARLLDAQDGMRVLDACAAPGGKSAHLLERHEIELTALEVDAARARRIEENLARLHLAAKVEIGDARKPAGWWDGRLFERILADVPCSASGVVRRHPDIKWLRRPEDVAGFAQTQAAILDALWPLLAPGGKMLYCTCSVFPGENAGQVRAFVARHPDARRLPTGGSEEELQLMPSATHDGFYYALLEKMP
ncbi:16S rRNA (cytosine(967)-C(5))-methyltransferase RsmB [Sulfuricystis multivorans]|uniref:16S rRNA (cytosine(967)-C(5))-methyltransferase RsmB n=1 Tax=Sulfuricystis multivorans TaxID=2211108 RepID=UPI000F84D911|nr:16S rRNA (cytosine(967)-C(5))-methyltransferase RsmB [Sulfuricystis multivorans]